MFRHDTFYFVLLEKNKIDKMSQADRAKRKYQNNRPQEKACNEERGQLIGGKQRVLLKRQQRHPEAEIR